MFLRAGLGVILMPVMFILPLVLLYFIIKLAVKHAVQELKRDGTI